MKGWLAAFSERRLEKRGYIERGDEMRKKA
jgi:hypothetical protein